jgi:hypothetical protein
MSSPSLWGPVLGFGLLVASEVAGACPSCGVKSEESDLQKQFETARKAKDWTAADRLYPKLVAMRSNLEGVRDYLLYERGRCSEVLQMLDAERQQVSGSERIPDHSQMLGALVCEAARLEPSDRPKSMALLWRSPRQGNADLSASERPIRGLCQSTGPLPSGDALSKGAWPCPRLQWLRHSVPDRRRTH